MSITLRGPAPGPFAILLSGSGTGLPGWTPFNYDMGVSQGRIVPVNATPFRTSGRITCVNAETYDFAALALTDPTKDIVIRVVADGTAQDIRFTMGAGQDFVDPALATAAEVVAVLNTGGKLGATNAMSGATAAVASSRVQITHDTAGDTHTLEIAAAPAACLDANSLLAFAGGVAPGTGGDYLYVLGSDLLPAPDFDIGMGSFVTVSQPIDLTGVNFVRAFWRTRQPSDMPVPEDLVALAGPVTLVHGGYTGAASLHARLVIGAGTGQVRYWAVEEGAGGTGVIVTQNNPLALSSPLSVLVGGSTIKVYLGTDGAGALISTADEVAAAIRANPSAAALVTPWANLNGVATVAAAGGGALAATADALDRLVTTDDFFRTDHRGRLARVSGSGLGNDGDHTIVQVLDAKNALLAGPVSSEGAGFGAVTIGALWRCSVLVDGFEAAALNEYRDRDVARLDMAAHVSKLNGVHDVAFRFTLVEAS